MEKKTCENGYIYNTDIKECEPAPIKEVKEVKPVNDDIDDIFNIPELMKILTIFLQIIIVIVILYIIYIFYDIFGETILTVYNFAYMKIIELYTYLNVSQKGLFKDEIEFTAIKAKSDYELANIEFENLKNSSLKIQDFINRNNIKNA